MNVRNEIAELGGVASVAEANGIPAQTIYSWIKRNSIPRWWRKLLNLD